MRVKVPSRHGSPVHPGDMVRYILKGPPPISQPEFAEALHVSLMSVSLLINRRRNVTPEMALRLAKATSTSPLFWLNMQQEWGLYQARQKMNDELSHIMPVVPGPIRVGTTWKHTRSKSLGRQLMTRRLEHVASA